MEPREKYRQEKIALKNYVLELGHSTIKQVHLALRAIGEKNPALSTEISEGTANARSLERVIDEVSTRMIALESPVASDLRNIVMYIKIVGNFERINVHATKLAKAYQLVNRDFLDRYVSHVEDMVNIALRMLDIVLDAIDREEAGQVSEIPALDDAIDTIYATNRTKVIAAMQDDKRSIDDGVALLTLLRFSERLGDHVTNIAEWVYYSVTGKHIELNS